MLLEGVNRRWAMDFVSDTFAHGRTFRALTIIDEFTRECLRIEADTSLPGMRVIRVLEQLADTRGLPQEIQVDHGPEFICRSFRSWCEAHHALLRYIDAGRPMQNGHIESFNLMADYGMNASTQSGSPAWPTLAANSKLGEPITNQSRPRSALGYSTPNEFAGLIAQRQPQPTMMGKLL